MSPTDQFTPSGGGASDPHDNSAHDPNFHGATDNVENLPTGGADGTVPKASGGSLSMSTVSTESNVPDWELDANSPFTATNVTSKQFTIDGDWDEVLLVPARDNVGYREIQINGDTGSNYGYIDNSDANTTSVSQWALGLPTQRFDHIKLIANNNGSSIQLTTQPAADFTGLTVAGRNQNVSPPINTITLIDGSSNTRSIHLEIYGRTIA